MLSCGYQLLCLDRNALTDVLCVLFRVVDVGSEWRTFSNESNGTDRSRVGGGEVTFL